MGYGSESGSTNPFPLVCGFLIDNTGSLVLTTQKLQNIPDVTLARQPTA